MAPSEPDTITIECEPCGKRHEAHYCWDSPHGGHRVYEATCPEDLLTDWYTIEAAV